MPASTPSCSLPLYAVIDLGSNSFHMLITRLVADSVQVVDKVKRKVRLASGLDENNQLDKQSMARGWECLSFFAEQLQDIPSQNIKIVATATLRLAENRQQFIDIAEHILGQKIELISGEEEAHQIYLGVAHTTSSSDRRLVIDIGGASTELIVGSGFEPKKVCSLNMGCVTFNSAYFVHGKFTVEAFKLAISAASEVLLTQAEQYKQVGWDVALGVSGTLQAVVEVLSAQGKVANITLDNLLDLQQQVIACHRIENLNIVGLDVERKPVFAPGLSILIAIFQTLEVSSVQLAGGAIREGLLYELLPNMRNVNIRQRTLTGLIERFSIDEIHAYRVAEFTNEAFKKLQSSWQLNPDNLSLLQSAAVLHEIGLLLEYKANKKHAQYILSNADIAGFSLAERQLLIALVSNYKTDLNVELIHLQSYTTELQAIRLLVILRLAVLLSRRRTDSVTPEFELIADNNEINLQLSTPWIERHPLISDELNQEIKYLKILGINLSITAH